MLILQHSAVALLQRRMNVAYSADDEDDGDADYDDASYGDGADAGVVGGDATSGSYLCCYYY